MFTEVSAGSPAFLEANERFRRVPRGVSRRTLIANINFLAAWVAILLGLITGTVQGLFFHKEDWLGGYGSWKRRMLRLGHISFFGLAFLDLAFIMSASYLKLTEADILWSGRLILTGMIAMPTVCYLSVVNKNFRHLFFIPVISLLAAVVLFIIKIVPR